MATLHLAEGVTPIEGFLEWDGTVGIGEEWGMDQNGPDNANPPWAIDGLGDCGPTSVDHGNMAKAGSHEPYDQLGRPKFDGTRGTYYAIGLDAGEVGVPPAPADAPDQGVDNAHMLGCLYKWGLIDGYGEVPLNQLDWFAKTFKGAILGLVIDAGTAQGDFSWIPKTPWPAMPGAKDGHDVLLIKTHADGSGALVTWAEVQPFLAEFRAQITDAWVIWDKDDPAVNWPVLQAALDAVHGPRVLTPPPVVEITPPTPEQVAAANLVTLTDSSQWDLAHANGWPVSDWDGTAFVLEQPPFGAGPYYANAGFAFPPVKSTAAQSPTFWEGICHDLDNLRDWSKDRAEIHKIALQAAENESVALLAEQFAVLALKLGL
jgi:hypothetical protein